MPGGTQPSQTDEERALIAVIRARMDALGISQAELARRVGLAGSTLNEIFHGKKLLRWWQVIEIARALGVQAADLVAEAEKSGQL